MAGEGRSLERDGMVDYLAELAANIRSCPSRTACAEDDFEGWATLTRVIGDKVQLVGDDLFVTNPKRLKRASTRASPTRCWSRSTRSAR